MYVGFLFLGCLAAQCGGTTGKGKGKRRDEERRNM
jgi:hypothetical protein